MFNELSRIPKKLLRINKSKSIKVLLLKKSNISFWIIEKNKNSKVYIFTIIPSN